ncbi:MAG: PIN domain-containing protein [Gammaproteobacteria bacterium]
MKTTVMLDSHLLLLFVVGTTQRSYIAAHRRLRAYSEPDFVLLLQIIEHANNVVVTPNTLTETSNLLGYMAEPARTELFETFRTLIDASEEFHCESRVAANSPVFLRLGLTDAVLADSCKEHVSLVTADFDLYQATLASGGDVFNFNHLREFRGTV